jgi:hypothetical protein
MDLDQAKEMNKILMMINQAFYTQLQVIIDLNNRINILEAKCKNKK